MSTEKEVKKEKIDPKPFGYFFWRSNGDGTESSEMCKGEIPSWKMNVHSIIPLYVKPPKVSD
jgi:hypothetical protein